MLLRLLLAVSKSMAVKEFLGMNDPLMVFGKVNTKRVTLMR
jgi:hypothetical protein